MRPRTAVGLAVLLLVAAVVPAAAAVDHDDRTAQQRADPDRDVVGWEGGYWHDDPIDVDQSDGLSDAELDAYVSRSTARVEYLRQREFTADVPVEVISRSTFRERSDGGANDTAYGAWNNQVWEALFVVGEGTDVQAELQNTVGSSTAGFYAPGDDRIRIVTDTPARPTIDNATLVHELVHALQDQNGTLGDRLGNTSTQDADLAVDGLVEGEANYVEHRYAERCGAEWDCVATPADGGPGGDPPNLGILLTLLQPYSDGPVYVDWLRERGGWDAVDAAFDDPPDSSEQVIHLTDEDPVPVPYADRARGGWERFPDQGVDGADTVGEASMYVMFWYQARTADADTIRPGSLARTDGPLDTYNYDAPPSAGWGNDRLYPYRNASGEETRYGYVWVTEWDSDRDASQFVSAYRAVLDAHDATSPATDTYVIPDGDFADAFRIDRDGTRVTVVNAPTVDALDDVRPPASAAGGAGGEGDESDVSDLSAPGFGVLTAVLATLGAAVALARRRE
jgi:hypothetical protein